MSKCVLDKQVEPSFWEATSQRPAYADSTHLERPLKVHQIAVIEAGDAEEAHIALPLLVNVPPMQAPAGTPLEFHAG